MDDLSYPTGKRILGGVLWGSLWGGGFCGVILALVPVGPAGLALAFMVLLAAMGAGISLYWNAARAECFECGTVVTVTPSGGRCSGCGQRYRGVHRELIKVDGP
ncbi:hypothetical protein [Candidatus Cyanaurora vandensis]|uniref:hypothetical protein n=1 Tax=Candidatus Cyanaurora vandensis TaxID=2714958 RepID=UPI00257E2DBA|nr:hypothetical protein [Candidatus Cyanaurora vandensis]